MKWGDVIAATAADVEVPRSTVERIARSLLHNTADAVARGERVTMPGVGTIGSRWREERALRSVHDQRKVAVDGAWTPQFRAATRLRSALRARTGQLFKDPRHQAAWRLAETLVADLALYGAARAPKIPSDLDDAGAQELCVAALGADWRQARATFDRSVEPEIRSARDHLLHAARRRWSIDD